MTENLNSTPHPVRKQSAFSLSAIQVTGAASLPVLNSSIQLYHQYDFWAAFFVLLVGNIIVWLVAFSIIQMCSNSPKNTLDNVRTYLGKSGSYSVGIILIASTIAWFVLQTNLATEIIQRLVPLKEGFEINTFIQIGVALGVLSTLASMEGINGLRVVSSVSFPLLIIAFIVFLFFVPSFGAVSQKIQSSVGSLAIAIGTSLSVVVDYPTFFQHSKSKNQSLIAITTIQVITFLMGIGGLFLGEYISSTTDISGWNSVFNSQFIIQLLFLVLVILSCISVNMVNVYSASIAWELIVPIFAGRKEYTILGLGLTFAFILTTNLVPMQLLLTVTDIALSNLCVVLVVAYLSKTYLEKNVSSLDKFLCFIGWLVGSVIILIGGFEDPVNVLTLLMGYVVSVFVVIIVFSGKKLMHLRKH